MATEAEILGGLTPDTAEAVAELLDWAEDEGVPVTLIDGARSCEEQHALYAQGRTEPGRVVTWAPGCRSWHTHGRAVDVYAGSWATGDYLPIIEEWESMGGRTGASYGDYGHLQWTPGIALNEVCPDSAGRCSSARYGSPVMSAGVSPAAVAGGVALAAGGVAVAIWLVVRKR